MPRMAAALLQPDQRPLGRFQDLRHVGGEALAFRRDDKLARRAAEQFDAEQLFQAL